MPGWLPHYYLTSLRPMNNLKSIFHYGAMTNLVAWCPHTYLLDNLTTHLLADNIEFPSLWLLDRSPPLPSTASALVAINNTTWTFHSAMPHARCDRPAHFPLTISARWRRTSSSSFVLFFSSFYEINWVRSNSDANLIFVSFDCRQEQQQPARCESSSFKAVPPTPNIDTRWVALEKE